MRWKRERAKQMRWTYEESVMLSVRAKNQSTYGEHSVAFLAFACHLDIIETPLLDKADSGVGLHDPGQNGIKSQYDLKEIVR
jgi:hypothetical protein